MCGICGIIQLDGAGRVDPTVTDAMCATLTHRGPDDRGVYHDGPAALGQTRLSIIDVDGGHQPLSNEDGTVWVTFNGEIYNYRELADQLRSKGHVFRTRSDTEVLVHLYEEFGADFVTHLNGMFAAAIWDAAARRLVLVRDRMGQKPLYWMRTGGSLRFGSELKALLADGDVPREIDRQSLAQYLVYGCVPAPRTIFRDIHKLPPAGRLILDGGEIRTDTYWEYPLGRETSDMDLRTAEEQLLSLLRRSVKRRLMTEVPLGVFLSGGIDSSVIAALMCQESSSPVQSFAIGFSERYVDESCHARRVARHLGTEHEERILSPSESLDLVPKLGSLLDEPFADPSVIPTYLLSRFAREHVTVALGGDGGDELLAGYPLYRAHLLAERLTWLPAPIRSAARNTVSVFSRSSRFAHPLGQLDRFAAGLVAVDGIDRHYLWRGGFRPQDLGNLFAGDFACDVDPYGPARGYAERCASRDRVEQLMAVDTGLFLQDDVLVKVDRASMAASLEVRAPFLDVEVVEFLASLPLEFKLHGAQGKYLLKRVAAEFLPSEFIHRPKQGFELPLASWLRGDFREPLNDLLSEDRLSRAGIFDPAVVRELVDAHSSARRDEHDKLWRLFVFEMWCDAYLKPPGRSADGDRSASLSLVEPSAT